MKLKEGKSNIYTNEKTALIESMQSTIIYIKINLTILFKNVLHFLLNLLELDLQKIAVISVRVSSQHTFCKMHLMICLIVLK